MIYCIVMVEWAKKRHYNGTDVTNQGKNEKSSFWQMQLAIGLKMQRRESFNILNQFLKCSIGIKQCSLTLLNINFKHHVKYPITVWDSAYQF